MAVDTSDELHLAQLLQHAIDVNACKPGRVCNLFLTHRHLEPLQSTRATCYTPGNEFAEHVRYPRGTVTSANIQNPFTEDRRFDQHVAAYCLCDSRSLLQHGSQIRQRHRSDFAIGESVDTVIGMQETELLNTKQVTWHME